MKNFIEDVKYVWGKSNKIEKTIIAFIPIHIFNLTVTFFKFLNYE
jgi:hypothetical protein